ncbi:hypothetical protein [Janthinobacterium aquaticum]|uniref:hypothetical protein n=1 Tax=Janthinobacterium sp. FT58W TaxID=2654254 RepID=UPI0012651646|nr:hypothetical protein [Janthinobacterium sp. FT58W]KAB8045353.1 hypothetical protein GCM43_02795 [Janthinobacterium sp. FT58W]
MKLYCTTVVIPEFSDVAGKIAVLIKKRMNDAYKGQDFGGGLDTFTICLYVTYFEASSTLEEARLNHGIEIFQDFRTKELMKGLGIIVVVDPDLARNMTEEDFKSDVFNKIGYTFDNFDINTPSEFDVESFSFFVKSSLVS